MENKNVRNPYGSVEMQIFPKNASPIEHQLLALDELNLMRRDGMAFDGFEELPIPIGNRQ